MHPPERFPSHKAFQGLDPQGELPQRQGPLDAEMTRPQALQLLRSGIFRAVDDPQVLAPPAF
jgi:hypothetical protein